MLLKVTFDVAKSDVYHDAAALLRAASVIFDLCLMGDLMGD